MTPRHPRYPNTAQSLEFPQDFLWGSATASFQIEGATSSDGRTDSIWDEFCRVPGAIVNGDDGTIAADHYHRYRDDVALMKNLNLDAYRFSVAWPRVRPDGGAVNPAGLDFYSRLVDSLLEQEITPWLTLYHWDLPQALEERGGWTNRDTVDRFVEYALSVHEALKDRVRIWTTLNEPWCSAFLGYAGGEHAPGRQEPAQAMRAVHNLLLAHGRAITELRAQDPTATLGITLNFTHPEPKDPADAADVEAARRIDGLHNRLFLDPIFRGQYPQDVLDDTENLGWTEVIEDGDLAAISAPIDALGVNFYHGNEVSGHPQEVRETGLVRPQRPTRSPFVNAEDVAFVDRNLPLTDMGWEIQPWGLSDLLQRLHRDYDLPPLYITENGAAFADTVNADGQVDDPGRLEYIDAHLRAVHEAISAGVDVRGYFVWSLLDNFEWAYGYGKRFGIVYVDYETQERIPKASAKWFAQVAQSGTVPAQAEISVSDGN